jgi:hypothetical protein
LIIAAKKIGSKGKHKIVFSGSGDQALWDIATMSMRGIYSCQRWGNYHSRALVGSMMDPYVGIIYTTNSKKMKHGSKMLRRAVVRFVISKKKPALLIERIYPRLKNGNSPKNSMSFKRFAKFLKAKTNNKLPIIYGDEGYNYDASKNCKIPSTKVVRKIPSRLRSYRDSCVEYKHYPKFNDVSKVDIK